MNLLKQIWPTLGDSIGIKIPSEKNPSFTKKGPGRKHRQGKVKADNTTK